MKNNESKGRIFWGLALIIVGLLALAAQFVEFGESLGLLIVPALGVIFLLWGVLSRESGLLIPGGILGGVGVGILLITGPYEAASGQVQGGVFLLAFAAGWALIPILSSIVTGDNHWWALIPGGIMALVGSGLLFGGVAVTLLEFFDRIWPVFLILAGLYLIVRRAMGSRSA